MVHRKTPVHHDRYTSFLESPRSVIVSDALLQPYQSGPDLQECLEQRRDVL